MARDSVPTIVNITMTDADTEYSQAIPINARHFEFQCRAAYAVRFAFVTGKVATPTAPYMTLKANCAYDTGPVYADGAIPTLYVASSTAAQVVELLVWT